MNRHRPDALLLLFGLVFTGAALIALGGGLDVFTLARLDLDWLLPVGLVTFGAALAVSALRRRDTGG